MNMKSIKTLVYVSCIGLTTGLVSSCNKDEIEVIEQNTSWTIDQKYIDSDIREKVGDVPTSSLVYFNENTIRIDGINENKVTNIEGEKSFQLQVYSTQPTDKDIAIQAIVNEENLADGAILFPKEAYTIKNGVLKAGEIAATIEVELTNVNLLENGEYQLPLQLKIEEQENLKTAKMRGVFKIYAHIIHSFANIDSKNPKIEGDIFNDLLSLNTNNGYKYDLPYLINGSKGVGDNWWKENWESINPSTYLQASTPEEMTIKGVIINSEEGNNQLQGARVWVSQNGKLELQGYFKATDDHKEQYIIFKEPVTTKTIVFDEMSSKNGYRVSLTEIEFIK